jgi:hypothetical protein
VTKTLISSIAGARAVAVDAHGNLFVADDAESAIKEILAVNGAIPTAAGIK